MGKCITLKNHYGNQLLLDVSEVAVVYSKPSASGVSVIVIMKSGKEIHAIGFDSETIITAVYEARRRPSKHLDETLK